MNDLLSQEREKYQGIWSLPSYMDSSPGAVYAPMFADITRCRKGETVIDLGCGAGHGGKVLADEHGLEVTYLDLVQVGELEPFIEQPLWQPIHAGLGFDYGYCCDVMEHIPPEFTMLVVQNILRSCKRAFFSVSFLEDNFGKFVGAPLHLTVQKFEWWRDHLAMMGELVEARDMLGEGIFYVKSSHAGWPTEGD